MNTIAYRYLYSGIMPGKLTVVFTIIASIELLVAIFLLISNPSLKTAQIYFGTVGFNLIMGLLMNGFIIVTLVGALILPIWLGYIFYTDKSILGME